MFYSLMISLEEITIPENYPKHKVQDIENRIRNIQSDFQQIKKDSKNLSDNVQKNINQNQAQLIDIIARNA